VSTKSKSTPAAGKAAQKSSQRLWLILGAAALIAVILGFGLPRLAQQGAFMNVTSMGGGMNAWLATGLPVASGN